LIVDQYKPLLAVLFFEHFDFDSLEFYDCLLLAIDPAGKNEQQELPRLHDKIYDSSILKTINKI
jgi:hypothetical protein